MFWVTWLILFINVPLVAYQNWTQVYAIEGPTSSFKVQIVVGCFLVGLYGNTCWWGCIGIPDSLMLLGSIGGIVLDILMVKGKETEFYRRQRQ